MIDKNTKKTLYLLLLRYNQTFCHRLRRKIKYHIIKGEYYKNEFTTFSFHTFSDIMTIRKVKRKNLDNLMLIFQLNVQFYLTLLNIILFSAYLGEIRINISSGCKMILLSIRHCVKCEVRMMKRPSAAEQWDVRRSWTERERNREMRSFYRFHCSEWDV